MYSWNITVDVYKVRRTPEASSKTQTDLEMWRGTVPWFTQSSAPCSTCKNTFGHTDYLFTINNNQIFDIYSRVSFPLPLPRCSTLPSVS